MKKLWKGLLIAFAVLIGLVLCYVAYVLIAYHRIPDNQALQVQSSQAQPEAETGTVYRAMTWNLGFGAYEDDYGFFMDGGTQSWAWSEERLRKNLTQIQSRLREKDADV